MSVLNDDIEHLLRRAGFGASPEDADTFRNMSVPAAISHLIDYEGRPDDVDARIGRPDHALVTTSGDLFAPDINIDDARQRWARRSEAGRRGGIAPSRVEHSSQLGDSRAARTVDGRG